MNRSESEVLLSLPKQLPMIFFLVGYFVRLDLYNTWDSSAPPINQWSSYARDLISQVFFEVWAISVTFKEKKLSEYFISA